MSCRELDVKMDTALMSVNCGYFCIVCHVETDQNRPFSTSYAKLTLS